MRQRNGTQSRGFTLVELMVSAAIGVVLVGAAVTFLEEGIGISYRVAQRAEMQQNARIAINLMSQDLSIAGTGIPQGGIQLPSGGGSQNSRFACDASSCYLTANTYTDGRLYSVTPGDGRGPIINGVATDIVTLVHIDDSGLDLGQYPLVGATPSGNQIEVDPRTSPPINDPAVGVRDGDILMICNANGCAVGAVTQVNGGQFVGFANDDPLNLNQPSAAFGNIASILDPPNGPSIPPTQAARINVVTYYLEVPPGPDGVAGTTDDGGPRLMRQVNAHPPAPVAENVENLQVTYDLYDENLAVATSARADAGGTPNQIRKINIELSLRSPLPGLFQSGYERTTLVTAVSARNLSFRDRYE